MTKAKSILGAAALALSTLAILHPCFAGAAGRRAAQHAQPAWSSIHTRIPRSAVRRSQMPQISVAALPAGAFPVLPPLDHAGAVMTDWPRTAESPESASPPARAPPLS